MTSRVHGLAPPVHGQPQPKLTVPDPFIPERPASRSSVPALLMGPPRWRSESAFADALCFLVRSQARSWLCPGERADRAVPDDDLAVGVRGDPENPALQRDCFRTAQEYFFIERSVFLAINFTQYTVNDRWLP